MPLHFFVLDSLAGMAEEVQPDISGMLAAWGAGDPKALNGLISAVYPELRRIARRHLSRSSDQSMESAAVANEVYLKLLRARGIQCESRLRFFALCAQVIRRILVDQARRQCYAKRGGGAIQVSLDEAALGVPSRDTGILALDEALASLAKIDPRKGRVVELRYFGGLTVEETAEVLGISPETAHRDWRMAKSWLFRELSGSQGAADV
jgi:RNA polymerase sigma-70 factor (ECF subfamily)